MCMEKWNWVAPVRTMVDTEMNYPNLLSRKHVLFFCREWSQYMASSFYLLQGPSQLQGVTWGHTVFLSSHLATGQGIKAWQFWLSTEEFWTHCPEFCVSLAKASKGLVHNSATYFVHFYFLSLISQVLIPCKHLAPQIWPQLLLTEI